VYHYKGLAGRVFDLNQEKHFFSKVLSMLCLKISIPSVFLITRQTLRTYLIKGLAERISGRANKRRSIKTGLCQ
jgi:hypothetical protein